MITFKPIVIPGGRRKDGTWPVKIRVTFKGQSRRLPTTLTCVDADLTRSGRIKNANVLEKAAELITRMRASCNQLSPFVVETWTVDDVVRWIRKDLTAEQWRLDFFQFADEYVATKKESTRAVYLSALRTFETFLGKRAVDVNEITRQMLLDFLDFVDARPAMHRSKTGALVETKREKVSNAISRVYLSKLSHIYGKAKFRHNDEDSGIIRIPRNPFAGLTARDYPNIGQPSLGVEVMQKVIDWEPQDWIEEIAQAAFLFSFGTMGANLTDMRSQVEPPTDGIWVYNRSKTADRRVDRAEVRVRIPEQISPFVAKLRGPQGRSGKWLGTLQRWSRDNSATLMINTALRRWAEREGIKPFTFYAARHTWATLARSVGVEKATVDEALAHIGDYRVADIYAERNWSLAWEANEKVMALFRWP